MLLIFYSYGDRIGRFECIIFYFQICSTFNFSCIGLLDTVFSASFPVVALSRRTLRSSQQQENVLENISQNKAEQNLNALKVSCCSLPVKLKVPCLPNLVFVA